MWVGVVSFRFQEFSLATVDFVEFYVTNTLHILTINIVTNKYTQ